MNAAAILRDLVAATPAGWSERDRETAAGIAQALLVETGRQLAGEDRGAQLAELRAAARNVAIAAALRGETAILRAARTAAEGLFARWLSPT